MSSSSAMEKASSSSGKEGPFCSTLAEIYGMIFFFNLIAPLMTSKASYFAEILPIPT
jgi:hypothetical protein